MMLARFSSHVSLGFVREKADLTPAQKAARTRARRVAAKKAAENGKNNSSPRPAALIETTVEAFLPVSVDLTRRTSGRDLRFAVKSDGVLVGTLIMGRGSVQWWAAKAKRPTGEWTWREFARLLEQK
jgi:hypothetical protein